MMQVRTQTLTGAKIIIETLKNLGVKNIFGYPGGIVLKVYDEIFQQTEIKHILSRHEQASIHEAEGYARTTLAQAEKINGSCVGVSLVTSGPGATNIVTGLANAYLDGYPLVVLTGQVSKELIGKDAFQEVDIVDITRPCTKATYQVTDVQDLEQTLISAFTTALSGKKGPVVVDLAKNIFTEATNFQGLTLPEIKNDTQDYKINQIVDLLNKAQRPVIVAGGGVTHSKADKELLNLAQTLQIPVVTTMMGLGSFPQNSPLNFGLIGLFGDFSANQILREADLILSLGARFNDRISCCFKNGELSRNTIQVDINKNEFSRVFNAKLAIEADIKSLLNLFLQNSSSCQNFQNWTIEAQKLRQHNASIVKKSDKLHSFEVVEELNNFLQNRTLTITTEVGQHQLWAAKGCNFTKTGQFITSGGSGTMGFGFPAAIGACIAQNKQEVVCISGDGSLQMNLQELATCVEYDLPVKIILLNNGYLGMVRQLQEKFCEKRYSETQIFNPDFLKIAQAYGIEAIRVEKKEEIESALTKCFDSKKVFLIDFIVEPMEVV